MSHMMSGAEVATALRLNIKTIRKHLPSHKIGNRVLYAVADVEKILGHKIDEPAPNWIYGAMICENPVTTEKVEVPVALVAEIRASPDGKRLSQIVHCPRCFGYHSHGVSEGYQEGFRTGHCPAWQKDRGDYYIPYADHLPVTPFRQSRFRNSKHI